jgi:hypothetical protein
MDERAELVERLFNVLEEVKNCAVDAQGEKREFLEWLQDKAEKLLDMERELMRTNYEKI